MAMDFRCGKKGNERMELALFAARKEKKFPKGRKT